MSRRPTPVSRRVLSSRSLWLCATAIAMTAVACSSGQAPTDGSVDARDVPVADVAADSSMPPSDADDGATSDTLDDTLVAETMLIDALADDTVSLDAPPADAPGFDAPAADSPVADAPASDVAMPDAPAADVIAPDAGRDPEIIGAGDIAGVLLLFGQNDTAAIIDRYPAATVFTLGDNAYQSGSSLEFTLWYAPSWGRFLSRTRPCAGNHDYMTGGASGYFDYFGARAGTRGQGWYSYNLGAWHLVVLNSNCSDIGGCDAASPQGRWLAADLAATRSSCVLASWHHPRYSSGRHGDSTSVQPFWQTLYDANADVVLTGHDHTYERFGPMNGAGVADSARGMRQYVVGSGGAPHYTFTRVAPNSEFRNETEWGVLRMVLHPMSYDWEFITPGGIRDRGTGVCH